MLSALYSQKLATPPTLGPEDPHRLLVCLHHALEGEWLTQAINLTETINSHLAHVHPQQCGCSPNVT